MLPVVTGHLSHLLHLLPVTNHFILPLIRHHLVPGSAGVEDTLANLLHQHSLRFFPAKASLFPHTSFPHRRISDIKAGSRCVARYSDRRVELYCVGADHRQRHYVGRAERSGRCATEMMATATGRRCCCCCYYYYCWRRAAAAWFLMITVISTLNELGQHFYYTAMVL